MRIAFVYFLLLFILSVRVQESTKYKSYHPKVNKRYTSTVGLTFSVWLIFVSLDKIAIKRKNKASNQVQDNFYKFAHSAKPDSNTKYFFVL